MGYIFLKLTVYVSEPVCDHSGLCYPLHEYSTTICGLPYWPISHYSESTTNIIVGLCPHFVHWHLWIFLHSQCFNHKQMFLREPFLESLILAWPPPSNRLKGTISSWWECLCSVTSVFGNLSGQYPDTEGLGLIKPKDAVPGNSWVMMKCKWDRSCSPISSCELPGFGTSSACNQLLICRSIWAPSLVWGWLPSQRGFAALTFLVLRV